MGRLRRRFGIGALGLVTLGGIACDRNAAVCARVGHHKVETSAFQAYLGAVTGQTWQSVEERVASRLFDQFLDQEVVAAAARVRRPMPIPIEPGERAATVRGLLEEVCGAEPALDPALVQQQLQRRLGESRPATAHVRQMVLATAEDAQAVRRRLAAGEDFGKLSAEASTAPNANDGGEIGALVQGSLPPELDRAIFGLGPGEISEPVRGPSGFHLFQVLELRPAGPPNAGVEETRVRRELRELQARQRSRDCIDRLSREVGVTVHPDHLWFTYQGRYAEETHDESTDGTSTQVAG
jgi:peptidyl-prolyl cis-trans isomerase C